MPRITATKQTRPDSIPCGLGRRLLAMVYDAIVLLAILMAATAIAMAAGFREVTAGKDILFTVYLLATWFLYLALLWRHGGMTLGMRAWRIAIVSDGGGRPGWGQCLVRCLVSLPSAACAGLGFAWAFFDPDKRCWHDLASRTRLIRFP